MTTPVLPPCRACRAALADPDAAYCPRCGTNQDLDLIAVIPLERPSPKGGQRGQSGVDNDGNAARSAPSFLRFGLFAIVVLAVLALVNKSTNPDQPAPTTTRPLVTSTTRIKVSDLAPTTTLAPVATTPLGTVAMPAPLGGFLYGLRDDGSLVEIDLTSGAARGWTLPLLTGKTPGRVFVLPDGLVISSAGRSIAVPFKGGPRKTDGFVPGTIVASGPAVALVDVDSDNAGYVVIDGTGRRLAEGQIGPERRPIASFNGQVVVAATGHVGLLDTASRKATSLFDGRLLAADGFGPAWLDCAALINCALRIGTWSNPSRVSFVPPLRPGGLLDAAFTTGQRHLVVTSSGVGGSSSYLVDPNSGTTRQLRTTSPNNYGTFVSAAGDWLVTIPADQTVQAVIFEELQQNGRTVAVKVPGRFVALTSSSSAITDDE